MLLNPSELQAGWMAWFWFCLVGSPLVLLEDLLKIYRKVSQVDLSWRSFRTQEILFVNPWGCKSELGTVVLPVLPEVLEPTCGSVVARAWINWGQPSTKLWWKLLCLLTLYLFTVLIFRLCMAVQEQMGWPRTIPKLPACKYNGKKSYIVFKYQIIVFTPA